MIPLSWWLMLACVRGPTPDALSAEAGAHNEEAMVFYDRGEFEPAFVEFQAAYDAMPEPRRDLAGRELLLGSMYASLLQAHDASRRPAPLCRLQAVLQTHIDALTRAFPEDPGKPELLSAKSRHADVTTKLAAFGSDACTAGAGKSDAGGAAARPGAPVAGAGKSDAGGAGKSDAPVAGAGKSDAGEAGTARPGAPAAPRPAPVRDEIPPRHLHIAGGVTFGLGVGLLVATAVGIAGGARRRGRVDDIAAGSAGRPLDLDELARLRDLRAEALTFRRLAIGAGVATGLTLALGTTLFVLARRAARDRRLSLTPWWSRSAVGLTFTLRVDSVPRTTRGTRR
jgi:hypothetical protein